MNSLPAKLCTKCGELKELTEFKPRKTSPDGRRGECRLCSNQYNRNRYSENPEVRVAAHRWQRENLEAARVHKRRWEANNQDKIKLKNERYREANRELVNQRTKLWIKNNKDKQAASERRRRARKLNNGVKYYTELQVLNQYGSVCHLCNSEIDLNAPRRVGVPGWENGLHIDHLIPISKGGPDMLENVRPSHGKCNLTKNAKIYLVTDEIQDQGE